MFASASSPDTWPEALAIVAVCMLAAWTIWLWHR